MVLNLDDKGESGAESAKTFAEILCSAVVTGARIIRKYIIDRLAQCGKMSSKQRAERHLNWVYTAQYVCKLQNCKYRDT